MTTVERRSSTNAVTPKAHDYMFSPEPFAMRNSMMSPAHESFQGKILSARSGKNAHDVMSMGALGSEKHSREVSPVQP